MKQLILIFTLLFQCFSNVAFANRVVPILTKGESVTLETEYEIGDVAVSNPKVVDFFVQESRRSLYLNAKEDGFATLTLWSTDSQQQEEIPIQVSSLQKEQIFQMAKEALGSMTTIDFQLRNGLLYIVGEASSPSDFKKIQEFAQQNPQVESEVVLAKPVLNTLIDQILTAIATPGIKVRSVRNQIILEGVAYSEASAKKAHEIAKLYVSDCLNLIEVKNQNRSLGKEKMVQLDLYFMEIQKSALQTMGIQWAPGSFPKSGPANMSLGGGGTNNGVGDLAKSLIGFVLHLIPKIRFMKEHGVGRVLENPTLFVKSGDTATFFSGVQVPYFSQETVQFKEVGVQLQAEPIISGKDVDIKLTASISSPSPHIDGGINTHTVATTAYIPSGQAAVLGGILTNRDIKTYNRIPKELATSTALFTLFLSKDFQSSHSELVLFVEPKIVDPLLPAEEEKKNWEKLEEEIVRERSLKEYREFISKGGGK